MSSDFFLRIPLKVRLQRLRMKTFSQFAVDFIFFADEQVFTVKEL